MRFDRVRAVVAAVSLATSAACVREAPRRQPHESAPPAQTTRPAPAADARSRDAQEPAMLAQSDAELRRRLEASARALDPRVFLDLSQRFSDELRDDLRIANAALVELAKRKSAELEKPLSLADGEPAELPPLALYERALLSRCQADGTGCRAEFDYFRQDPLSARVALELARRSNGVRDRYRRLMVAFDLKNSLPDRELELEILGGYRALRSELVANPRPEDRRSFGSLPAAVKLIFQTRAADLGDGNWLEALEPWSSAQNRADALGAAAMDVYRFAAGRGLYSSDGALRPSLRKAIEQTAADPTGLLARAKAIHPSAKQNLGLEPLEPVDEYFLIVDRAFRGEWSPGDALLAWNGSRKNAVRLSSAMKAYVQAEFVLAMQESHKELAAFFRRDIAGVVNEDAFRRAITRGQIAGPRWKEIVLRGAENLRQLAILAIGDARSAGAGSPAAKAEAFFGGLRRNVKMAVIYPQMIAMAYFMGVYDLKVVLRFFWLKFEIDTGKIMDTLFHGQAQPWFDYGTDPSAPQAHEIFHAYYFLVASGALEIWGIDPKDLFGMIANKLLAGRLTNVREASRTVGEQYETAEWADIERICAGVRSGRPYPVATSLGRLRDGGFIGESLRRLQNGLGTRGSVYRQVGTVHVSDADVAYNPFSILTNEIGELLRISVDPDLAQLRQLLAIHRDLFAVELGAGAADAAKPLEEIVARHQAVRDEWLRRIHSIRERWTTCYFTLLRKGLDVDLDLIEAEELHLRQVHADILRLRVNPALQDEVDRKYEIKTAPGYTGRSRVLPSGYFMTPLDFRIRVAGYLRHGVRTEFGSKDPVDPNIRVYIPPNVLDQSEDAQFNEPATVTFAEDAETFVRAGLSAMFSDSSNFALWLNGFRVSLASLSTVQMGLGIYYRLGPAPAADGGARLEITAEEMASVPVRIVELVTMNDRQAKLLGRIGKRTIHYQDLLKDTFVDRRTREGFPYLDNVYDWGNREFLGALGYQQRYPPEFMGPGDILPARTADMQPVLESAKAFSTARLQDRPYAFELPRAIDDRTASYHRARVAFDLTKRSELESAIAAKEAADRAAGAIPALLVNLDRPAYRPDRYLSPTLRREYANTISEFHRDTYHCFDPDPEQAKACSW